MLLTPPHSTSNKITVIMCQHTCLFWFYFIIFYNLSCPGFIYQYHTPTKLMLFINLNMTRDLFKRTKIQKITIKNYMSSKTCCKSRHIHQLKQYICQQMIHTLTVAMTITFYTSQYWSWSGFFSIREVQDNSQGFL